MKKLSLIILFIFSLFSEVFASDPPPHFTITGSLNAQGHVSSIPSGANLQLVNHRRNYDKWYQEVVLTDDDGNVIDNRPLRVSQEYINMQMKNKINSQLDFIDEQTGATVRGYDTQEYIIISSNNSGWKTYTIQFVDPDGNGVDHKGIPSGSPSYYKVSQRYLDQDRLKNVVDESTVVRQTVASSGSQKPCPVGESSSAPVTSPRPRIRPENLNTTAVPDGSSYAYLKDRRTSLRSGGYNSCMAQKEDIQEQFVSKHPFGSMIFQRGPPPFIGPQVMSFVT